MQGLPFAHCSRPFPFYGTHSYYDTPGTGPSVVYSTVELSSRAPQMHDTSDFRRRRDTGGGELFPLVSVVMVVPWRKVRFPFAKRC